MIRSRYQIDSRYTPPFLAPPYQTHLDTIQSTRDLHRHPAKEPQLWSQQQDAGQKYLSHESPAQQYSAYGVHDSAQYAVGSFSVEYGGCTFYDTAHEVTEDDSHSQIVFGSEHDPNGRRAYDIPQKFLPKPLSVRKYNQLESTASKIGDEITTRKHSPDQDSVHGSRNRQHEEQIPADWLWGAAEMAGFNGYPFWED